MLAAFKKTFFLLTLCGYHWLASAQFVLKGKVVDATSAKPVTAASVYLASTSVGTISADDGHFVFDRIPPGKYDLVVSSVGFGHYTRQVSLAQSDSFLLIQLQPAATALKEVVVELSSNGYYDPVENMVADGYWGWASKIVNLLPFDYNPEQ